MSERLIPITDADKDVQEEISALTGELIVMLNARAPTYSRQAILMALLNLFFVAADHYGEMDVAVDAARRNAEEFARIRASRPADAHVH